MKRSNGRYYIGRVLKMGLLTAEKFCDAIKNPRAIKHGKFKWTIMGVDEGLIGKDEYIYGRLVKYDEAGAVKVVNEKAGVETEIAAPDMIVATSPFVYFKSFSGIAYLHVWNNIQEDVFRHRLIDLVKEKYDSFFVDCSIEAISDLQSFSSRITELKYISDIVARVYPPNPLFAPLWKSLMDYMRERNSTSVKVHEENRKDNVGIKTELPTILEGIQEEGALDVATPGIVDAAILMAADGYGRGKISGMTGEHKHVIVETNEVRKSFLFAKEPTPHELAMRVYEVLREISIERKMKHAKKQR